jgi:RNA polymerase sigma factor (sigma-70 family)
VDGYARTVLVNTFLAEQRTPWRRRVLLVGAEPEASALVPDLDAALDLRTALAGLPTKQRAAVVLRYYCDLPVEEVARTLGCSEGTVKSQTSRGIDTLRRRLTSLPARPYPAGSYEEYKP